MKKIIFFFITMLFSFCAFSENANLSENDIALEYANYIFNQIGTKNFDGENAQKITELTPYLTAEQREDLYNENERLAVGPFLWNLLLGFGSGSFRQGDYGVAHLQLWGDILGYGLMIPGMIITSNSTDEDNLKTATALTTIGSLITLGVAIPALIRPWGFANRRNERLQKALNVNSEGKARGSVSFAPVIDPVNTNYGMLAKINF